MHNKIIEKPSVSGYYWVSYYYGRSEVIYLAPNLRTVWRVGEGKPADAEFITEWFKRVEEI